MHHRELAIRVLVWHTAYSLHRDSPQYVVLVASKDYHMLGFTVLTPKKIIRGIEIRWKFVDLYRAHRALGQEA